MRKPLILWGGTDIDSNFFYGKPRSKYADLPNISRDIAERTYYNNAVEHNKPVIGVCRGAQLVCAMNGGELYQHSKHTNQYHDIDAVDFNGTEVSFDSVPADHHQIMIPKGNYKILAWNPNPVTVWEDDNSFKIITDTPEIIWYPDTNSLAIQPHPEWYKNSSDFVTWLNNILNELEIDYAF